MKYLSNFRSLSVYRDINSRSTWHESVKYSFHRASKASKRNEIYNVKHRRGKPKRKAAENPVKTPSVRNTRSWRVAFYLSSNQPGALLQGLMSPSFYFSARDRRREISLLFQHCFLFFMKSVPATGVDERKGRRLLSSEAAAETPSL